MWLSIWRLLRLMLAGGGCPSNKKTAQPNRRAGLGMTAVTRLAGRLILIGRRRDGADGAASAARVQVAAGGECGGPCALRGPGERQAVRAGTRRVPGPDLSRRSRRRRSWSASWPSRAGLGDLLTLCMAMGLGVVSVRRLPGETATRPGAAAADPAAAHPRGMNDEHAADPARPHRRLRCG